MSHLSTGGRRGIATAMLLGLLATGAACGTQTGNDTDVSDAVPGSAPSSTPQGQSKRAVEADALRAAKGQLPPSPHASSGRRFAGGRR